MNQTWFLVLTVLTALALDAAIIRYWRKRRRAQSDIPPPILSWIFNLRATIRRIQHALGTAIPSWIASGCAHVERMLSPLWQAAERTLERIPEPLRVPALAGFLASLLLYLATRLIGLEDFPIYFFTDEAVQTVLAADFLENGFRDQYGTLFPTYFDNASLFNLSISVYLQIIPELIFDRSVFVTRAASVLVTLSGAAALGLILRDGFRAALWWLGPLMLAVVPVWFLHSRTAFETVLMVSFYAWFLYFYLLYRRRSPSYLHPALLCGALAFYSYSPGQMTMVVTGVLLLISDLRYHLQHRRQAAIGGLLLVALVVPYLRFQTRHPGEMVLHLRVVDSYWLQSISLFDKLKRFLGLYAAGHNPAYWFFAHDKEIIRHIVRGHPFIPTLFLPLMVLGLAFAIRSIKRSECRVLIASLLAAPTGMALAGLGITRTLVYVVPSLLLSTLGLEVIASRIRRDRRRILAAFLLFAGLSGASVLLLVECLTNGPTWFDDYGLYGMQYGARQVFGEISTFLEESGYQEIVLSPDWANGTDILLRYFLPGEGRITLLGSSGLVEHHIDDLEQKLFVMTPEEYALVSESPVFSERQVLKTLPYPDGRDGFFFIHLTYVDRAEEILAELREQRRQPVSESTLLDGQTVLIKHTPFGLGTLGDLFDGDSFTVVRTQESNPATLDIAFPEPREVSGIEMMVGTMDFELFVEVLEAGSEEWFSYHWEYEDLPEDPMVRATFTSGPHRISRMFIEIRNPNEDRYWMIHIFDLILH